MTTTAPKTATFGEYGDALTVITTLAADTTWHDIHGLVMMSGAHREMVAGLGGAFDVDNPTHVAKLTDRANSTATIAAARAFAAAGMAITITLRSSDDSPLLWRYPVDPDSTVTVSRLCTIDERAVVKMVDAITFESGRAAYTMPAADVRVYPTGSVFV